MNVQTLDHLNMTVRSVEESSSWYGRVFGFHVVESGSYRGRAWSILQSGSALLCIYEHPGRDAPDLDGHVHHGVSHFGLRIADRTEWESTIARERVKVQYGGAKRWPHSTSWYVHDPNGYEIEVALWDRGEPTFG